MAATALALLAVMTSCDNNEGKTADTTVAESSPTIEKGTEASTTVAAESEIDTEVHTEAVTTESPATETSDVTTVPEETTEAVTRIDYLELDLSEYVQIEKEDYTNISIDLPKYLLIDDSEVEAYITALRFEYGTAVNGTEQVTDKAISWGDVAYIYYRGEIDGEEFEGGSNMDAAKPHELGIGSSSFIPGFESGLVGIIPNQTSKDAPAVIETKFPENYRNAAVAGKDVTFYVYVEYIVQYTMPEYDKSFVVDTLKYEPLKEFYASDKALLDEFTEYVRKYLESQNEESVSKAKNTALWKYIMENLVFIKLPESEVEYYYNAYIAQVDMYYQYYGSAYESYDAFARAYLGLAEDADWKAELRKIGEKTVMNDLSLFAVIKAEGFDNPTAEEIDAHLDFLVEYYEGKYTKEDILKELGEEGARESAMYKAFDDFLAENVTVNYV